MTAVAQTWLDAGAIDKPPLHECRFNDFQRELVETAAVLDRLPLAIWGGLAAGKTVGLAQLVRFVAQTRPGARILFGMDSSPSMENITIPSCRGVFGRAATWLPSKSRFEFPNGSVVVLRYYDVPATVTEADNPWEGLTEIHLVVVDEAQKLPPLVFLHAGDRARTPVRDLSGRWRSAGVVINGRPAANDWWPRDVEAAGGFTIRTDSYVNARNLDPKWFDRQKAARSPAQYRALIEGGAMPVDGAVYSDWSDSPWPAGNILDDFAYDPTKSTIAAIDFGLGWPSVLFVQTVERKDAAGRKITLDVVFDEMHPHECLTPQLVRKILERAWPRNYSGHRPAGVPWTLDAAVVDPAGIATDKHTGESDIGLMKRAPTAALGANAGYLGGGLGVPVHYTTDSDRRHVRTGIERVQALVLAHDGTRRLVMSQQCHAKAKAAGPGVRSLHKALLHYAWETAGRAKKGDKTQSDHACDAIRYFSIWARWHGQSIASPGTYTRPTNTPTSPVADYMGDR